MRFTWLSNSVWAGTGYGSQTRLFLPRFQSAGHAVANLAFYGLEGGVQTWNGIPIYPRHRHQYGLDVAAGHTLHFRAKVMLSLIDAWVVEAAFIKLIKWVPWFPVDCDPLPQPVAEALKHAYDRITMSRFGEQVAQAAGFDSTYIPHAFDPAIFHPRDKAECRKQLGWPQDRFIASIVAANKGIPSRKAWPQQLEAFRLLAEKHDDVLLYLHTNAEGMGGYNLTDAVERIGIAGKTVMVDQYEYILGYPDEYLATVYAASDVLLSVSMGEGFGIPIIEAQACGCPVIVGDWTAMPELLRGGWKVEKSEAEKYLVPIGSFQWLPHPAAIAERLEGAYLLAGTDAGLDLSLRATAVKDDYAVDVVMERHWLPYLTKLEERIDAEARNHSAGPVRVHRPNGATPRMAGSRA